MKKKIIALCAIVVFVLIGIFLFIFNHKHSEPNDNVKTEISNESGKTITKKDSENKNEKITEDKEKTEEVEKNENEEKINAPGEKSFISGKSNLLNSANFDYIPVSAIAELALLPENIQNSVKRIAQNSRVYLLNKHADDVVLITENQNNIRHDIQFVKILIPSGQQIYTTFGYNGKIQDTDNEVWDYDDNFSYPTPTKHVKFNKEGDVEFIEYWYYSKDNPIKYEMKDSSGNIIAMRKEIADSNGNLKVENIIYNKDGATKLGVVTNLNGTNLERFTYYNAEKPSDSATIYGEFKNGLKTKETIYSPNMSVKNFYTIEYNDGNKESITIYDSKKQKIGEIHNSD